MFFSTHLYSQFFANRESLSNARYFVSLKNFDEAAYHYEKLVSKKPNNYKILLEYSEVLINQNNLKKADSIVQIIINLRANNKILSNAYLSLGLIQKKLGHYDKAKMYLNNSNEYNNSGNNAATLKIKRERESIDWAVKHSQDSILLKKTEFPFSSYHASLHSVSDSFIVASVYDLAGIYKINPSLNVSNNQLILTKNDREQILGNGSFSKDQKYFYFSKCTENLKCVLMVASIKNNKISSIDTLKSDFFDYEYSYTMPSFGYINDKKVLFFCSNKIHGKGGLDIYFGELRAPFKLTNIKSIPVINSIEDDISPILDIDNKRLYFSSSWFDNFGGHDVFYSQVNGNLFSKPENVGLPINSSMDETSYAILDSIHLVTTNRFSSLYEGNCCNNIVAFKNKLNTEILPSDTLGNQIVSTSGDENISNIKKKLPLTLYFHNDIPNPKSFDTITNITYNETYFEYLNLIPTYKQKFSSGLTTSQQLLAELDMTHFFESKVQKGYNDLIEVLSIIETELEKGTHIELVIKGYASPLAKSKYNNNLSKRRIQSFKNLLIQYNNGVLKQYITDWSPNKAKLTFKEIPFGEDKSEKYVSDNPNDKKKSIYSIQAALERKIEILDIVEIKD